MREQLGPEAPPQPEVQTEEPKTEEERLAELPPGLRAHHKEHKNPLHFYEDAYRVARVCETPEKVTEFNKLSWKEQKKMVPGLYEGYSGAGWGFMIGMAEQYLETEAQESIKERLAALPEIVQDNFREGGWTERDPGVQTEMLDIWEDALSLIKQYDSKEKIIKLLQLDPKTRNRIMAPFVTNTGGKWNPGVLGHATAYFMLAKEKQEK